MGRAHSFRVAVWGEAAETSLESKLLRKIDFFILTFCCLCFFFNYLDRAALANAYVSGLREDLNLVGNDYNIVVTCLNIGYILGMIPHALAIQKIRPSIWFPLMTLTWALLTMCCAAATQLSHLCAIRFFQGMIEASTYSGAQYVMGSWYKPNELGKRLGLFSVSGMAGTMFAGIMMTAIYQSMNGIAGLPGWRWVFIIDGNITLPIAVFGYFFFPDLPETTKAFYLAAEEKTLAISRIPPKDPDGHKLGFSLIKRVLLSPKAWIFTMFWVLGGGLEAYCNQNCMLLWMKATNRYSVPQNNNYPLGVTAIGIAATLATSVAIDATGVHAPWGIMACALQLISASIMFCFNRTGDSAKFAAFYIAGTAYMIQPVVWTWVTSVLIRTGDDAARAIILYSMNGASSVLFSIYGIAIYPATDAATGFFKGTVTITVVIGLLLIWIGLVWWQDATTKCFVTDRQTHSGVDDVEVSAATNLVDEKDGIGRRWLIA